MSDANEPITAEWLEQLGAIRRGAWWWLDNRFAFIEGFANWIVMDDCEIKCYSATTRGQIHRLRRALKGEV